MQRRGFHDFYSIEEHTWCVSHDVAVKPTAYYSLTQVSQFFMTGELAWSWRLVSLVCMSDL